MVEAKIGAVQHEIIAEIAKRRADLSDRLFNVYHSYRLFIGLVLLAISTQNFISIRRG